VDPLPDPLPGRPLPARPIAEVVRAWLQWFGLIRLVVIALAVGAVGAGAYWLLRAPATPIENTLPMATRASTSTVTASGPATTSLTPVDGTSTTSVAAGASSGAPAGVVVVDVAGAVAAPGVYELTSGARAHDAIEIAGGLAADADVEALNLAAPLRDGDRLYVPHVGLPVPTVIEPTGGGGAPVDSSTAPAGPIDLNRATVEQLDVLPGIGPATAAAIVTYREQVGPFAAVDDLLKVPGIGPAKLDALRDLVVV
jgi:competence protein ComEA